MKQKIFALTLSLFIFSTLSLASADRQSKKEIIPGIFRVTYTKGVYWEKDEDNLIPLETSVEVHTKTSWFLYVHFSDGEKKSEKLYQMHTNPELSNKLEKAPPELIKKGLDRFVTQKQFKGVDKITVARNFLLDEENPITYRS